MRKEELKTPTILLNLETLKGNCTMKNGLRKK